MRQIAKDLGIGKSTVAEFATKHAKDMPRNKGGRSKCLSHQDRRFLVRSITSGSAKTAVDATKQLQAGLNISVTPHTVRNALKEVGLGAIKKPAKPKITKKQACARLDFAKSHCNWTLDDWQQVIWSDETKVNRFCSDGCLWAWIRDGEELQPRHVKQTVKHGGGSIMMWGCMTWHGIGYCCRINGKMDQQMYLQILGDELLQTIEYYNMDQNHVIFQHDNDPKHTAKSVKAWLAKQDFKVLEWPASSPDLNPIEHLWAHLKMQLAKYESPPKGLNELWERLEDEWEKISVDVVRNLIQSLPCRLEAVVKAKGYWTKY
jgi:transposase